MSLFTRRNGSARTPDLAFCAFVLCLKTGWRAPLPQPPMHEPGEPSTNGRYSARIASAMLPQMVGLRYLAVLRFRARLLGRLRHTGGDAGFERTDPAAAHGHRVAVRAGQLDHAAVARTLEPDHPFDVDDMAAVDAHEAAGVEARLHVADC